MNHQRSQINYHRRKQKRQLKAAQKTNTAIAYKAAHAADRGLKGSQPKMGVKTRKSRSRGIPDGFPVQQPIAAMPPFLQLLNRWQPEPVEKRVTPFPVREWRRTG